MLAGAATHFVTDRVVLTPQHSQLTIAAADPTIGAVVSGGVRLTPTWRPAAGLPRTVDNSTIYEADAGRLDGDTAAAVLELFDEATQARLVPARYPNGNPELDQSNYGLRAQSYLPAHQLGNATVVHNTSYARGGMFSTFRVGVGGPASVFEPPISYCKHH